MAGLLHDFIYWYTHAPEAAHPTQYDNALIALAAVAGVVWTGGIVALQFKRLLMHNVFGLDLLQAIYIACPMALFLTPQVFRYAVTLFIVLYIVRTARSLIIHRTLDKYKVAVMRRLKLVRLDSSDLLANTYHQFLRYNFLTIGAQIFFMVLIAWPYQFTVASLGTATLYIGLQFVLSFLYTEPERVTNADKRLMEISNAMRGIEPNAIP